MALAGTLAAVDLPFQEAIDYFSGKASVTTRRWTDVWETAHTKSFMVAGAASKALVDDFRGAIQKAIEQGTTLEEFRKDFDRIVAKNGWKGWTGSETEAGRAWRARVIYETNLNQAYAAGRYAQMTDPDVLRVFPFWVYRHSGNPHPRLQHKAWDGLTLEATSSWWSTNYPPNGFGCGCTVEPISARGLKRQGKSGPDEAPPLDITPKLVGRSSTRTQLTPAGVDPGFAYNPGQAWKGEVKPPWDAKWEASPGYKPPPPAPPAPKIAASEPDALARRVEALRNGAGVSDMSDAEIEAWFTEQLPAPTGREPPMILPPTPGRPTPPIPAPTEPSPLERRIARLPRAPVVPPAPVRMPLDLTPIEEPPLIVPPTPGRKGRRIPKPKGTG